GMPEAARYLLNIDAGVAQQRRMTMPLRYNNDKREKASIQGRSDSRGNFVQFVNGQNTKYGSLFQFGVQHLDTSAPDCYF
ncbi:MAG: hypothetical protein IJI27_00735, partial [Oscillospiraceae bacterium]|nr:hypothetical protein [Oscillospiraceae bacterium]